MTKKQEFSNVTKHYLAEFYNILDNMVEEMTSVNLTNSISHNFILQMIPHHEAAIEMSQNLLQYTTYIPLQNIAENIITEQTKSIEDMKKAFEKCRTYENTTQELSAYQKSFDAISQLMFSQMKNALSTNSINQNFMREMIPHHEGAIRMSRNALRYSICPELKPILNAIIFSQSKGVREMSYLLRVAPKC